MFSLAVLFFCQSLMQFLKDAAPLSTGNLHRTVGINQAPGRWLLQCLHKEGNTPAAWRVTSTCPCCRDGCRGHGLALWLAVY